MRIIQIQTRGDWVGFSHWLPKSQRTVGSHIRTDLLHKALRTIQKARYFNQIVNSTQKTPWAGIKKTGIESLSLSDRLVWVSYLGVENYGRRTAWCQVLSASNCRASSSLASNCRVPMFEGGGYRDSERSLTKIRQLHGERNRHDASQIHPPCSTPASCQTTAQYTRPCPKDSAIGAAPRVADSANRVLRRDFRAWNSDRRDSADRADILRKYIPLKLTSVTDIIEYAWKTKSPLSNFPIASFPSKTQAIIAPRSWAVRICW